MLACRPTYFSCILTLRCILSDLRERRNGTHRKHREDQEISQDAKRVTSTKSRPLRTASNTTPTSGDYGPLTENPRLVKTHGKTASDDNEHRDTYNEHGEEDVSGEVELNVTKRQHQQRSHRSTLTRLAGGFSLRTRLCPHPMNPYRIYIKEITM